ncbi:hypothetical protein GW17_00050680 [Ensete ventricosum]|nr:hypothetical protein GW17_00050680 [Ensete ventricosum]
MLLWLSSILWFIRCSCTLRESMESEESVSGSGKLQTDAPGVDVVSQVVSLEGAWSNSRGNRGRSSTGWLPEAALLVTASSQPGAGRLLGVVSLAVGRAMRCIFVMFVVIYCWSGWLRFLMYPLGHLSSYDLNRTAPDLPQSRGSSSPLLSLLASGHSPSIRILSFPQTLASACTGDPTMALSIGFLPAFTIGDGASGAALPRRAVLLPSFAPPRRWAVAAAVEAAPDATGKRRPRGITKPRPVSPELQAVVGEAEIPRTQALKKIWAYIKENNLQVLFFILHL